MPLAMMWERRPDWLNAEIDAKFARVSYGISRHWGFHGTNSNYQIATTTFRDLSDHHWEQVNNDSPPSECRPLRILEVGCGAGHLILGKVPGDVAHGVTAYDYAKAGFATPPADSYFIGNAERLTGVRGLLPHYDLVLSFYTVQHLVDKVGSIEQMADRVEPGGLLCLDRFNMYNTFAPSDNIVPPKRLPKLGLSSREMLRIVLRSGFSQADLSKVAPRRRRQPISGEGHIVLRRDNPEPIRFGLGYELVQPLPEEFLFIPTWRYTYPGEST